MKIYRTSAGILLRAAGRGAQVQGEWDAFVNDEALAEKTARILAIEGQPIEETNDALPAGLLPPIGNQEVWASGVTYWRSRKARMEESKAAGGGDFYDRVYAAERPELFFKAPAYRTVGHDDPVRIRADSQWNVPEPELALFITRSGKIIGYTIGNDMSSRDIEGENPLYLPQAKSYDGATALGPCLYIPPAPLPPTTNIQMTVARAGQVVFAGDTTLAQMKRQPEELAAYLYRELTFPVGCLLFTGTGVIPPDEFTLISGDEITITIPPIGTLRNVVA
ncbi:MAG: fumarylacetoacetate hydrolase family protein [Bacteroidota bacterium]